MGTSAGPAAGENIGVSFCILHCIQHGKYKDDSADGGYDRKRSVRCNIFRTGVSVLPQASGESLIALDNSPQTLHNSSVWIYFLYTGYKCRVCEEFFMNIINIEHISKIYGEKVIYEDASFGVQQEDKIGIVGINGTGARVKIRLS